MKREYIRVKPSREALNPDEIVRNLASLHKLGEERKKKGLFRTKGPNSPTFEFLLISEGQDKPVKFFYGTDDEYMDTLETDLETAYPNSFDIDREEIDLQDIIIPPVRYNDTDDYLDEFGDRIENWGEIDIGNPVAKDNVVNPENQGLRVADETGVELPGNPEPTSNDDGDGILARPEIDDVSPIVIEWNGDGDRKRDWMTTIKRYTALMEKDEDEVENRSPLARLIQQIAKTALPTAFQVTFRRKESWEKKADKRRRDLHLKRDTRKQKVAYEISEVLHPSTSETRKEKRRNYMEEEGESSKKDNSADIGDIGPRAAFIDDKHPKRTFDVNIKAACVATRAVTVEEAKEEMSKMRYVLDHLDGQFYSLESHILTDTKGRIRTKKHGTKALKRMLDRDLTVDNSGNVRTEIVLNADELGNFTIVPSSKGLTVEGTRETRAKPESRNPLPRPDPDIMADFHNPGMRIGYALDEDSEPENEPAQIPPPLLKTHYGRFATTGAGKSKALLNDMLSLHENTDGPVMLIDPKGDGMAENYLRSHWKRFGDLDKVYYFPVPDILPGFSFFNIDPALENDQRRVDAVQNKADAYEEILKLVMGAEKYGESKVAPNLIKSIIKALFDEEYGTTNGTDRESPNYFSHHDLEMSAMQLRAAASEDDEGRVPEVSDERIHETLTRHLLSMESDFAVIMDAVFNRLDYIKQDAHLRRIFDNTENNFDFRDILDEDAVILFDLGDMRDDPSLMMTGLILTNLWDALEESKREDWSENHIVNIIIDEAASVAVSDIMNKMLEKGRGFGLSVGLAMQFPEQMRAVSEQAYMNVLNNVGSMMIGKIPLDREVAEAMAHEDMDPEDFRNRFKSLPRGEWIAQLPSPKFKETGPEPFSLDPMPIPAGHPESQSPLSNPEEKAFRDGLLEDTLRRTREQFGIGDEDADEEQPDVPSAEDILGGVDEDDDSESDGDSDGDVSDDDSGGDETGGSGKSGLDGIIGGSIDDDGGSSMADSFGSGSVDEDTADSGASASNETPDTSPDQPPVGTSPDESEDSPSDDSPPMPGSSSPNTDDTPDSPNNSGGSSSGSSYKKDLDFGEDPESTETETDGGGDPNMPDLSVNASKQNQPHPGDDGPPQIEGSADDPSEQTDGGAGSPTDSTTEQPENALQEDIERKISTWDINTIHATAEEIATSDRGSDNKLSMLSALAARARAHGLDIEVKKDFTDLVTNHVFNTTNSNDEDASASGGTGNLNSGTARSVPDAVTNFDPAYPAEAVSRLDDYNLTKDEGAFLLSVINTINGQNDYPLTHTMTPLKNSIGDIDIDCLEDEGFIKVHNLVKRGVWYTPTTKAQKAVGETRKAGAWYGDIGEDTPHRIAVEVTRQYLELLPDVARAEAYYPLDEEGVMDVVGRDENGDVIYAVEIEVGSVSGRLTGTQNWESVIKDYDQLTDLPGESWWVMETAPTADHIFNYLIRHDKLPFTDTISGPVSRKRKQLNEHPSRLPGMDAVYSLSELWDAVDAGEPITD